MKNPIGRPRGVSKIPITVTIERELIPWIDSKPNRSNVINIALRRLYETENEDNKSFLMKKLLKLKKQRDELIESIVELQTKIEALDQETEKQGDMIDNKYGV